MSDLKAAAIAALENWSIGNYPAQAQFIDPSMVQYYNDSLQRYGEAFVQDRQETHTDLSLSRVLRWAMRSTLEGDSRLQRAFQIRVSEIPQHLAENAALHHIIRTVAPAVMGQDGAHEIGIDRVSGI